MAQIYGSFTGVSASNVRPYIEWNYSQDIAGNFSDVTATLYFQKLNSSYSGWNLANNHNNTSNIDGETNTSNNNFDLRTVSLQAVKTVSKRVYHNADGSKAIYIGWSGNTQISWGTYNFGATVSLNTIPREAYATNTPDFTVETDPYVTLYNPGNLAIRAYLYVNNTYIADFSFGNVGAFSIPLNSTHDAAIYAQMTNVTARQAFIDVGTFTNTGYGTQVGGWRRVYCTAYINTATNTPIFTTFTLENVDKSIAVKDKYNNTLITSSTATLLGSSNNRIIKNYSKMRAVITAANKATARNSATMVKYRYGVGLQYAEASWSSGSTVNIDIDNVDRGDASVLAYDSRNLTTQVNVSIGLAVDYVPLSLFNLSFARDNGIGTPTKLKFSGTLWKKYFSSNSTTNSGGGVLNDVVLQYRYKETTVAWGAQSWTTITGSATIDSSGNITYDAYIDGDLGASGFNADKSYNIEVRGYDRLSAVIIEEVLSVGTPLIHYTKNGISIKKRFDATDSAVLQVNGAVTLYEISATPSNPDSSVEGHVYVKGDKFIIQWNDAGTVRYKYLDLTGTGVTWVHTTTAP